MRRPLLFIASLASWAIYGGPTAPAHAEVVIDTVHVGNVGNANDSTGFGGVDYAYAIGRFEVTNIQYVEFLNSVDPQSLNGLGLYSSAMSTSLNGGILRDTNAAAGNRYSVRPGRENHAVNFVTEYDAMRFANWMHNGQNGVTETGAYTIFGGTATPSNALQLTRNADARWALVSENEWYKAAYHANDGVTANYHRFPTQSNSAPHSDQAPGAGSPDPTNVANVFRDDGVANGYDDGFAASGGTSFPTVPGLLDVGSYSQTTSAYGAFDLAGSVHEWSESVVGSNRVIRGGSFWSATFGIDLDDANTRFTGLPSGFEERDIGFRLTRLATAVPEPSSMLAWSSLLLLGVVRRRFRNANAATKRGSNSDALD